VSLPAFDFFSRADGPLGANWTTQNGTAGIVSNEAQVTATNTEVFWNADVFGNDQYSAVVTTVVIGNEGCIVRASGTGGSRNNYLSYGGSDIYKDVNGSYSLLASGSGGHANGDTVRVEVLGTTITVKVNGVQKNSVVDSTHASGSAGFFGDHASSRFDNWEGGNIDTLLPFQTMIGARPTRRRA
jgi:hypothetical protein